MSSEKKGERIMFKVLKMQLNIDSAKKTNAKKIPKGVKYMS